jgi:hypothetical protein
MSGRHSTGQLAQLNAVRNRDEYLVLDLDTASVYPSTMAR